MTYDFDRIPDRIHSYSIKWREAAALSEGALFDENGETNYKNPGLCLPFNVADMDLICPQPLIDKMHEVADHGIYGYSFQASVPEYYDSIISWYRRRFGVTLQRDWLMFSNGTVEAVAHAVRAFTNVGDGVILCRPVYGHFTSCIEEECYRKVVNSQLICQDGYYTVDWADFEQKCAVPTNRLFVLCSPANPVGRVWTPEELQRMYDICKKHHVLMLSDEIHCDIILKGHRHTTMLSATDDYSNLIVVSGINKTFNVAGLSCSTVIIPDATLRGVFQKDFGMRPITPFAIGALIAAYNDCDDWMEQMLAYVEANIDAAIDFLHRRMPKVQVRKPEGTYILWLDFSAYGLSADEIHDRIYNRARVKLQDGLVHDPVHGGQFQRLCVPCARKLLMEGLERIAAQFESSPTLSD